MSDSDDSDTFRPNTLQEIHEEIKRCKKNPDTSKMFVSGWDDDDQDVDFANKPR